MTTYVPKPIAERFLRMMMVDPVCGKDLRGGGTFRLGPVTQLHNGTVYFFCSDGCRQRFEQNPEQFRRAS